MSLRPRLLAAAVAATAITAVAVPAVGAGTSDDGQGLERRATKTVKVGDDFFAPTQLKIKQDDKVKWSWLPDNLNSHNVVLKKGPPGVKRRDFESVSGSIGVRFKRKFEKKGQYDFICTFHRSVMEMTVTVKKN